MALEFLIPLLCMIPCLSKHLYNDLIYLMQDFVTISGVLQQNYAGIPVLPGGETVEQLEV